MYITLSVKYAFPFHETDKINNVHYMELKTNYTYVQYSRNGYPSRENYDFTKWMQHI